MIHIFNRREVCITRSGPEQLRVCTLLEGAGIEVQVLCGTLGSNVGRYHGNPFIRTEDAYEYRIYVHKMDFDRAMQALNRG